MNPARGSLLGIEHMEAAEILKLLKFARRMNPDHARPLLKGKRVMLLSTRRPPVRGVRLKSRPNRWGRIPF